MRLVVILAAASLGLMGAAQQYNWGDDTGVLGDDASKRVCRGLKGTTLPASDRPSAAQRPTLKGCDPEALYYGMGVPADPAKARQCSYAMLGTKEDTSFFGAHAMLMTVYANGKGAPRNLDLAIHLACTFEDAAPAEYEARINHLLEMKKGGRSSADFDICDDITSGLAGGYCAAHEQDIQKIRRAGELNRITAAWTPAQRTAFTALDKARAAYSDERVAKEVDVSGSGRASFMIDAEEGVAEGFLKLLKRLEAGQGASADRLTLAAADRELNAVYSRVQGARDPTWGTVTKSGIRETQRTWIRYRDAWLAFAKIRYPAVSQEALAAALTAERTKLLKDDFDY